MKHSFQRILIPILFLCMLFALPYTRASAAVKTEDRELWELSDEPIGTDFVFFHNRNYPRIVDGASLFSASQVSELEDRSRELREEYGTDLVVVTSDSRYGREPQDLADDYYDYNGYGIGSDRTGMLLLIVVEDEHDRWYHISTTGDEMERFGDVMDDFKSAVSSALGDDYASGAAAFMNFTEKQYKAEDTWFYRTFGCFPPDSSDLWLIFLPAFLTALIAVSVMKSGHKKTGAAVQASQYAVPGSFELYRRNDYFAGKHVDRVRRETERSSSGGGGGFHTSSSGSSHGGGGGRF